MIKLSRRLFSKLIVLSTSTAILGPLRTWAKGHLIKETIDKAALEAYVDTLIPPDETPGAAALGVADKILMKAESESGYRAIIISGCQWLNQKARQEGSDSFSHLAVESKQKVVQIAESSLPGSPENSFFSKTLNDSFVFYYSHPKALEQFSYAGPPQPMGFPDHALPPK